MGTQIDHLDQTEVTLPAHSTGPWKIFSEDEDYIHIERLKDGTGQNIIDVFCSEDDNRDIEECRANARLVANAQVLFPNP